MELKFGVRYSSQEARLVEMVRKNVLAARGNWVDILSYDEMKGRFAFDVEFKMLEFELFPKRLHPKLPKREIGQSKAAYSDVVRRIVWETAHKDINEQRAEGVVGKRYCLKARLVKPSAEEFFVDDAPTEIKALAANLADRTDPLWDVALEYARKPRWAYSVKRVGR